MGKKLQGALILPLALGALWQAAVALHLLDPLFFPPPTALAKAFGAMVASGVLGSSIGTTLTRTAIAFLIGSILGIAAAAGMGASVFVRRSLEPLIAGINSMPKVTLFPMLLVLAGTGEPARLILMSATAFVIVAMNTLDGIRGIAPHFAEMAANYGASKAMLLRRVYLPGSAPYLFTGLRLALGRTLVLGITVEMLGGSAGGLGNLIWMSWQTFAIERLYVAVIVSSLLGFSIHRGLLFAEARVIPWKVR